MPKWTVVVACAAIASVALYFTFFRSSDEERIRKVLDDLTAAVAVKEGDNVISRTARLRSRMKGVVDDHVGVNIPELGVDARGRARLEEEATRAGLMFQTADCMLSNVSIRIDPSKTLAQADATALVTAKRGGERRVDKRAVHFLLRKTDGDWKVSTIDVALPRGD